MHIKSIILSLAALAAAQVSVGLVQAQTPIRDRAEEARETVRQGAQDVVETVCDKSRQVADSVRRKAPVVVDSIRSKAPVVADTIGARAERVGRRVAGAVRENANRDSIRSKSRAAGRRAAILGDSVATKSGRLFRRIEQRLDDGNSGPGETTGQGD